MSGLPRRSLAVLLTVAASHLALGSHAKAQSTSANPRLLQAIDYYTGVAGQVDDARARLIVEELSSDRSDTLSRMWLARVYSTGRMTFERDQARARTIASEVIADIRNLASQGDLEATFLMGTAYDEGLGVSVDFTEALRWYRRAAHHGHVLGAHNVGNVYRDGRGVEVDHARAAMWWLRAARAGDVIPALRLGEAYEAGRGVPMNLDSARLWYGRAAAAGNVQAAESLRRLGG